MAAISANLLAATAPPVKPPASRSNESTPTSGFATVLTDTVNRRTATADASAPADRLPPAESTLPDDTEPADETTDEQDAVAAGGLLLPPVPPILVVEPTQTPGSVVPTDLPSPVPTTAIPTATPGTTDTLASRTERLPLTTATAQPPVASNPVATTPPAPPTAPDEPRTRPLPTVAPQPVTVPVANTPTEVVTAAARPPAIAPQVPVVTDLRQQSPALPPEVGYGLVNPNVSGPQAVTPVTATGAGRPQAQVGLAASAVRTPASTADVTAPTATQWTPVGPPVTTPALLPTQPTVEVPATDSAAPLAFSPPLLRGLTHDETSTLETPVGVNTPLLTGPLPQAEPSTTVPTRPVPNAEPPVAPQLSEAFVTHARMVERGGSHEFQLRLDPPELGEVKVRVLAMGDRVEARLVVTDDAVKRLIESQLPELRQRLEAAGLTVPKFDVTTGGDGRANTGGGRERPETANPVPTRTAAPTRPTLRTAASGGLIDVTA